MKTANKRSFRVIEWGNRADINDSVKYGIQTKLIGWEVRWMHCSSENKALLFNTKKEALEEIKRLKTQEWPTPAETPKP